MKDIILGELACQDYTDWIGLDCINPGVNRICIILYADYILLIALSVTMLENLLHKCETELNWLVMSINIKKSCCLRIGPRADAVRIYKQHLHEGHMKCFHIW